MSRLTLRYGEHVVELPKGESYIGRAVECQLRFNDAAISRRHLRIMCTSSGAFVENLSMTNGTRVNGQRLSDTHELGNGDTIEIGHRVLSVLVDNSSSYQDSGPITIDGPLHIGTGHVAADSGGFDYEDNPEVAVEVTRAGGGPLGVLASLGDTGFRNCPKCRTGVKRAQPSCPSCGYRWPMGSPSTPTQEIILKEMLKRVAPRHVVRVPVIYSSEFLTLDCIARDVSQGGMFIASEILDPVGTFCEITALPDGWPALQFEAEVCHVATDVLNGRPAGFGVAFTERSAPAIEWLESIDSRNT